MLARSITLFGAILVFLMTGCASPASEHERKQADKAALAILEVAAMTTSSESSYHFVMDYQLVFHQEGVSNQMPTTIVGDFQAPDRIEALQTWEFEGLPFEEQVIVIGPSSYATNVQTGEWEEMPEGAIMFSPQDLVTLDPSTIEDLVLVSEDELDGMPIYHLAGLVPFDTVGGTFAADLEGEVQLEYLIGAEDSLFQQVTLSGELEGPSGEVGIAGTTTYSDYEKQVAIEPPIVGEIVGQPTGDREPVAMKDNYMDAYVDWSPDGSKIVFASDRHDPNMLDRDIYVMDTDGSNLERLTWDPADTLIDDVFPQWSPEGNKILFLSTHTRDYSLFVIDPDGTNMIQLATFPAESPSWSPGGDRIAFQSNQDGNYNIYVIDADGSNLLQVTDDPADELFPVWSPDGKQIAFSSGQNDSSDIYVIDADGSNEIRLTNNSASNSSPTWSPGGEHIAFESDQTGEPDIYVIDADGTNALQLTDDPGYDGDIAWAPGGNQIAFISERDGDFDLHIMDADGSNVVQLTDTPSEDFNPKWSPDGRRIAFFTQEAGGGFPDWSLICVIDADGSNLVQLTQDWISLDSGKPPTIGEQKVPETEEKYVETSVDWSPDDARLAFLSNRHAPNSLSQEVYVMGADGSNPERLTWHPADSTPIISSPSWSPDGSRLMFVSFDGPIVYLMDADGANMHQLTDELAVSPTWSPDGQKIMFLSPVRNESVNPRGVRDIFTIDADGSNLVQLTDDPAEEWGPAWSPDGSHIAYTLWQDGVSEIYVMNADGSNKTRLTEDLRGFTELAWSPNGELIAFEWLQPSENDIYETGEHNIYVMNAEGTDLRLLTDESSYTYSDFVWSPDGSQLAFISDHHGHPDLYVMHVDGSNLVQLTDNPAKEMRPKWSPDGQRIAFSMQDAEYRPGTLPAWDYIAVINKDGSDLIQLTQDWISLDSE